MLNGKSNFGNRLVFAFIIKIEAEKLDGKSLKRLNILYEELNPSIRDGVLRSGMLSYLHLILK